jgi:hypothetical protein
MALPRRNGRFGLHQRDYGERQQIAEFSGARLKVGEKRRRRLLKNKMYKFSHLAIYSGDDEEKAGVR